MTVAHGMGMLVALMLLLVGWDDAAAASTAQEEANGGLWSMGIGARTEGAEYPGHTFGARFTVTTEDGDYIGECTLEEIETSVPWYNCRVDVPSDRVSLVWEDLDSIPAGYAPVENPIVFNPATYETGPHNIGAVFLNAPIDGSADTNTSGTSDVAIVPAENGQPVYDACFVIVDYSQIGCDENRDGKITFEDIPYGTWTVRQTADLGPGRAVADFTIRVTGAASGDGWERFPATVGSSGSSSSGSLDTSGSDASLSSGSVDIALITRDPDTGGLLTDTCYVLLGYSNEGCDENGDGQVTFADIPYGSYTVHQTRTPAGYPTINDYEIRVEPIQAVESVEMVGYPLSFVVKQAPEQNAPNTRNVSVVLIDARTGERVQDDFCLEIVGVSIEGCDTDLPDGQIDFLDVPTGGPYEINFTRIPPGYNVNLTFDGGPWLVIVNDGPEYPANRMAFVFVSSPDASGSAITPGSGSAIDVSDQGGYDAMVGEWYGKRRDVVLHADGTGIIDTRLDAFGNGLTYSVVVDPATSPVTATIVDVTPYGDIVHPSRHPTVGQTVTLEFQTHPDGALLVVHMYHDGPGMSFCSANEGNNVQGMCY